MIGLALALVRPAAAAEAAKPAQGAKPDCKQLYELYRTCHRYGAESDSTAGCLGTARDAMGRALARQAGKNPQAGLALTELVCATGCEDGLSGQERATAQEFSEAFCE